MKSIVAFANISLRNTIVYRAEVWYWFVLNLIPLFITTYLWLSIYKDAPAVAGYSLSMMVTYYLVVFLIRRLSSVPSFWLAHYIQQGGLSSFLLRPFSFLKYAVIHSLVEQMSGFLLSLPLVMVVVFLLRSFLTLPSGVVTWLLFFLSVGISVILSLLFGLLLGSIAFWITETGSLFHSYYTIVGFLGGGAIPLNFFPGAAQVILRYLPFAYLFDFPLRVYLSSGNEMEMIIGLAVGVFWVLVMSLLLKIVWSRGIRVYGAYGG